jgi:hypothetical protein
VISRSIPVSESAPSSRTPACRLVRSGCAPASWACRAPHVAPRRALQTDRDGSIVLLAAVLATIILVLERASMFEIQATVWWTTNAMGLAAESATAVRSRMACAIMPARDSG